MEKRINQRFEQYIGQFKDEIRHKIVELNIENGNNIERTAELVAFVYDYDRFILQKDDFSKRKRVKNSIPGENRCNARRANNEQCTRKRKDGHEYCGTHLKGTPNGYLNNNEDENSVFKKMEVFVQEINGIMYYLDQFQNVYQPEDIMSSRENPRIIAKYTKINGQYTIQL